MSFSFSAALLLLISSPLLSLHALGVPSACPYLLTSSSLKNYKRPSNNTLLVVIPWKVRFRQFVHFNPDTCFIDGFSIQVFLQALRRMQPQKQLEYKFVVYGDGKETPKYDKMVALVAEGVVDLVVGDLTISRERMNKVEFTMPYQATPLVMVTPFRYGSAGTDWDFLRPFSARLWIVLCAAFVFTGGALYLLENDPFPAPKKLPAAPHGGHSLSFAAAAAAAQTPEASAFATPRALSGRTDSFASEAELSTPASPQGALSASLASAPAQVEMNCTSLPSTDPSSLQRPGAPIHDQASHKHPFWNAFWFTSLCVFRAQQELVRTPLGRFVTVMWLFVMLIFNSSYTASLTSLLSAQKKYPTIANISSLVKDRNIPVGYLQNSIVTGYVKERFKNHTLVPISNETSYINALKQREVGAMLDELPFAQIILQSECFFIQDPADIGFPSWAGFAFAFNKKSNLVEEMSEAIVEMQQDGTLKRLQNGWGIGGIKSDSCGSAKEPSYLRFTSFKGLFSVLGGVYLLCLLWRLLSKAVQSHGERCGNVHAWARNGCNFCQGVLSSRHLRRVSDGRFEDT